MSLLCTKHGHNYVNFYANMLTKLVIESLQGTRPNEYVLQRVVGWKSSANGAFVCQSSEMESTTDYLVYLKHTLVRDRVC